jgi:hypothetical protein
MADRHLLTDEHPLRDSDLPQELAHRSTNGIEVSLLWSRGNDTVSVFVADGRSGNTLRIDARRDNALDVFNHPYAYAAADGELV